VSDLFAISQPGMMQAGIRNLPGAAIISGDLVLEAGGRFGSSIAT
jgi:hypothetical protein